jgi:hypothetical protein
MNQPDQSPPSAGALMMGPDGAVHVVPSGTLKASLPPGDLPDEATAASSGNIATDVPQDVRNRNAAQRALRDGPRTPGVVGPCFSYSADVPQDVRNRNAAQRTLRSLPRMPVPCFSYSADVPPGVRDRNAAQGTLRSLPSTPGVMGPCFSY